MNLYYNKLIIFILWSSCMLTAFSCTKFLEEKDPSNLTPESFYTIPEHAEAAIAAVYADTRFFTNAAGIFAANFQMLDAVTGTAGTEDGQNANLTSLYSLTYDGNNLFVTQWWSGLYKVIAQANMVIEKVPGINPMNAQQKAKIIGEAKFLRAWAYFYAVRLWGDVPLITSPQSAASENFYPARSPQEAVYKLITDDLIAAESAGLPWMDVSGRVSLAAVKAMLSKVYLTMAGYPLKKGATHYRLAADKAKEVITYATANPTEINLFATYGEIHHVSQENKLEHLFEIQYLASAAADNVNVQIYLLPNFKPITAFSQGGTGTTVPTTFFYNSYEPNDLRAKNQLGYFYTSYFEKGSGAPYNLGGPYIFKHFDVIAHGSPGVPGLAKSDLNIPQIRYAEVLLIYAEAELEAGGINQAAYDAFKRIRDRAQLPTPTIGFYNLQSLREAIWRERWHELCYEGIIWFDMVRLRKVYNETTNAFDEFVGHVNKNSNQPLQQKHLLFPLPTPEIRNNPNLSQNEGYPK